MTTNYELRPRRLTAFDHFEKIYRFNIENERLWRGRYPDHASWIREVKRGLQQNNYTRVAFGLFLQKKALPVSETLVCSVIVKRNSFASYLELKNLIVFEEDAGIGEDEISEFRSECHLQIIDYVKRFAENRGYPKLATELLNSNLLDRQLIKSFIQADFSIVGNQAGRYSEGDDIVYLSCDINRIYGLDPFDYISSTLWILRSFVPGIDVVRSDKLVCKCTTRDGENSVAKLDLLLVSNRNYEDAPRNKFNFIEFVLVLSDALVNASIRSIDSCHIDPEIESQRNGQFYVFSFMPRLDRVVEIELANHLSRFKPVYFDRDELNSMLQGVAARRKRLRRDLDFEQVGGFLTQSNPESLNFPTVERIFKEGKFPIYVQLGPRGRYLAQGHRVLFFYPNKDGEYRVWGYAELAEEAIYKDLNNHNRDTSIAIGLSEADVLFDQIEDAFEGDAEFIWDRNDFATHNRYNASNEVVCIPLASFTSLVDYEQPLDDLESEIPTDDLGEETALYLSKQEVEVFVAHTSQGATMSKEENVNSSPGNRDYLGAVAESMKSVPVLGQAILGPLTHLRNEEQAELKNQELRDLIEEGFEANRKQIEKSLEELLVREALADEADLSQRAIELASKILEAVHKGGDVKQDLRAEITRWPLPVTKQQLFKELKTQFPPPSETLKTSLQTTFGTRVTHLTDMSLLLDEVAEKCIQRDRGELTALFEELSLYAPNSLILKKCYEFLSQFPA